MKKNKEIVTTQISTGVTETVREEIKKAVGGFIRGNDGPEFFTPNTSGKVVVEPTAEVKALQKVIFNMKFDYDTLLNFTCQLLTHEQHTKFAAKKKEIFG